MKRCSLLIPIVFCSLFLTLSGQESKNHLTLGGSLVHFINIEDNGDFTPMTGYFKFAVSPGAELIYSRKISSKFLAETGVNFQWGKFSSYDELRQFRFYTYDISVPFCLKRIFRYRNGNKQYITTGVYLGKLIKVVCEGIDSWGWKKRDDQFVPYFSDNVFYSDLYLDWSYVFPRIKKLEISVSPFLRYRINSTWLNHYESRFFYGIKTNLTLKY